MFPQLYMAEYKAWQELVKTYGTAPTFIDKPGRNLSQDEAVQIVMYLVVNKRIQLIDPPLFNGYAVQIPVAGKRYKISNEMAGVTYKTSDPKVGWNYLPNVNLAWIVVLYRLAMGLLGEFGAKTIYWGGIGVGADDKPVTDSHHTGRAIDFFGAETREGKFQVDKDWGDKPIVTQKGRVSDWPASQIPFYRLWPVVDRGYYLFDWVYDFATRECQDLTTGPTAPGSGASRIGLRSYIIHPDYPDAAARKEHQSHMHFQIGTT